MKENRKSLFVLTSFAIAMAYLESAVVVYLRQLYYPAGFSMKLSPIPNWMLAVEVGREAATMIMLITIALMAFPTRKLRLAAFAFCFAVWDLFYYIWLKVLIGWPAEWLEWDILFLIPTVWASPWLAPVLVSLIISIGSGYIILHADKFALNLFHRYEWLTLIGGMGLILASFFSDTSTILAGDEPEHYAWWLFGLGFLSGVAVFIHHLYRSGINHSKENSDAKVKKPDLLK